MRAAYVSAKLPTFGVRQYGGRSVTILSYSPRDPALNSGIVVANIDFSQPEIPLRDDTQSAAQGSASSHTARGIQDPLSSKTTSHENTSARKNRGAVRVVPLLMCYLGYASSAPPAHHVATRAETRVSPSLFCLAVWCEQQSVFLGYRPQTMQVGMAGQGQDGHSCRAGSERLCGWY